MENTDYTLGLEFSFIKLLMGIREGHIVWEEDIIIP